MNTKNQIKNQKLFLIILGTVIFITTGLSTVYAVPSSQGQGFQNQLPTQNTNFAIQHHANNHSHLHRGTVSQNSNLGVTANNHSSSHLRTLSPTTTNTRTSNITSSDNSIFSGIMPNVAHAETENEANAENGVVPNNPTASSTGYGENNQNVMNPAKLDLVLLVTVFAITSIVVHSAWKVSATRRKFVLKKTV